MFNAINWGTVILSILMSLITVHLFTNIKIEKLIDKIDKQMVVYINDIKNATAYAIKNNK